MLNLKSIVSEVGTLGNMKTLVTTYEEIASIKMHRLRGTVLTSRTFIGELTDIYQELITTYKNQIIKLISKARAKKGSVTVRNSNGKTACVFLSSNSGLFGEIVRKTYKEFVRYNLQHEAEPVILGEFGKSLYEQEFPDKPFRYFKLEETESAKTMFKDVLEGLLEYDNVVIFYSRFETISSQYVAMLDFSGEQKKNAENVGKNVQYIFEPSLETVIEFFEKQIFSSILGQTFTESELASNAGRMVLLDLATENIGTRMKEIELQKKIAIHRIINKKQTEILSSMSLWRR